MSAVELLTTIVIVTVLISVILFGVSRFGRRLDSDRRRNPSMGESDGSWYFVRFDPDRREAGGE